MRHDERPGFTEVSQAPKMRAAGPSYAELLDLLATDAPRAGPR